MWENDMTNQQVLDDINNEYNNGNIVIMTSEGALKCPVKDMIEQPAESILYDLNRDIATLSTHAKSAKNLKFVNDIAVAHVIIELKQKIKEYEKKIDSLENENNLLKTSSMNSIKRNKILSKSDSNDYSKLKEGFNDSFEIYM